MPRPLNTKITYDLYLAPHEDGHYTKFFKMLSEHNLDVEAEFAAFPHGRAGFTRIRSIVRNRGQRPRYIHMILGERDLVRAMLLRLSGYRVTGFFYRIQHKQDAPLKTRMARTLLGIARFIGLVAYSLEEPVAMPREAFDRVILDVHDLADVVAEDFTMPAPQTRTCVIAGHITERKLVTEIIRRVEQVAHSGGQAIELRLVGRIECTYRKEIEAVTALLKDTLVTVKIFDERVSDSLLRGELERADIVFALYSDHVGSSGIVVNAMALGRPVLFFPIGALVSFSAQIPAGEQPIAVGDITKTISSALKRPQDYILDESTRSEFIAARSPNRFAETFHSALTTQR